MEWMAIIGDSIQYIEEHITEDVTADEVAKSKSVGVSPFYFQKGFAMLCGFSVAEYIIYYRGKVVGGIYDDRFLVKNIKSAVEKMSEATLELPYDGAKEMLLVDDIENKEFLRELLEAMYDELPALKKRK